MPIKNKMQLEAILNDNNIYYLYECLNNFYKSDVADITVHKIKVPKDYKNCRDHMFLVQLNLVKEWIEFNYIHDIKSIRFIRFIQ